MHVVSAVQDELIQLWMMNNCICACFCFNAFYFSIMFCLFYFLYMVMRLLVCLVNAMDRVLLAGRRHRDVTVEVHIVEEKVYYEGIQRCCTWRY